MSIEEFLKAAIVELKDIDVARLQPELTFEQLALDSLDYVELELRIKKKYKVTIGPELFVSGQLRKLGELYSYIESHQTFTAPRVPSIRETEMTQQTPIVWLDERGSIGVHNLIQKSHASSMGLNQVLPWNQGVDRACLPKKMEHSWIYGTPYFERLDEAQRHELLWLETARDVSMFITLEQTLPPLYMGYVTAHGDALPTDILEYLMIFSKEEIVHTLMFRRYMKLANLPLFAPPDGLHELLTGKLQLPEMGPVAGIMVTLLLEWVAELSAMYLSQHDEVDPLTREMFMQHHIEESRHIAFARWIGESFFEHAPEAEATAVRQLMHGVLARLIPQFTYNQEIAKHTSFVFPIAWDNKQQIDEVRASAANQALNQKRFAPLYTWLRKMGA